MCFYSAKCEEMEF